MLEARLCSSYNLTKLVLFPFALKEFSLSVQNRQSESGGNGLKLFLCANSEMKSLPSNGGNFGTNWTLSLVKCCDF